MSRRRQRTQGRALLWQDTPGGVQPGEIRDNPRDRRCPWCHAPPGEPCTVHTRRGRRPMLGYHDARTHQETA